MNPVLKGNTFNSVSFSEKTMTLNGVINKSFLLWAILAFGAYLGWTHPATVAPLFMPLIIAAFVFALIISFKHNACPFLSPFYAFLEGLVLGALTVFFEKDYPGIATSAIFLTISVLFCMLAAFRGGVIKPTNRFYAIVGVSTMAICLLYLVQILINTFGGVGMTFISGNSGLGILFSIFVTLIASFNLIIDFDQIQRGIANGAPKHMEWYGAFALMVTIVWLYLEILRLLAKLRR